MFSLLKPPPKATPVDSEKVVPVYQWLRWQVFIGIFVGYAGYYLVRKNFSLAIPELEAMGYSKSDLGFALSAVSIAYGISKFVMGGVSDQCNARFFLPIGLLLSGGIMVWMGLSHWAVSSISVMFTLLFLNGWFQGMGWPPSGRVMVHWFSQKERGTKMSIWNIAHNIGGGLVGPLAIGAVAYFKIWQSMLFVPGVIAIVISFIAFLLIRDTPESQGLPPIEVYKKDATAQVQEMSEALPLKQLLLKYVLYNKLLWYIALANAFIYLVRYGVLDWSPTYLKQVKHYDLSGSGWAYFAYEYAGIP
ncbi:MAG TPA: MFS transporter, partial [Cytophagales bacterium]|nr:MFS transporter [Cytophagales bacterium]